MKETEASRKYMLGVESRELRNQAQELRKQREDAMSGDPRTQVEADVFGASGAFRYWVGEMPGIVPNFADTVE